MAKLPEISFGRVQPRGAGLGAVADSTNTLAGAVRQPLDVVSQGLTVLGQELIKTEAARAAARGAQGLNEIKAGIKSKTVFSTQEIRDAVGADFDKIDPSLRKTLTRRVPSPEGMVEVDRDDIPAWQVAGYIYDAQAKKLVDEISKTISIEGWQTDFRDRFARHVISSKAEIVEFQTKAALAQMKTEHSQTIIDFANAGEFEAAREFLRTSNALDGDEKAKLAKQVALIETTKPLYDAIKTNDYGAMAQYIGQLNDPSKFTELSPEQRAAFTERMRAEIKEFEMEAERRRKAELKARDDAGWRGIFEVERAGGVLSLKLIPKTGTISAEAEKEMIAYVRARREGYTIKTDWKLYAGLRDLALRDNDKFLGTDLLKYRNRLADAQFKELLDLQLDMKGGGMAGGAGNVRTVKFLTEDEEINTKLAGRLDPKKDAEEIGFIKGVIQQEMDAEVKRLGRDLDAKERSEIIDRNIANLVNKKAGFFGGAKIPMQKYGIPARFAPTFAGILQALGVDPADDKAVKKHIEDYNAVEPEIERVWKEMAGTRELTPEIAATIWGHVRKNGPALQYRYVPRSLAQAVGVSTIPSFSSVDTSGNPLPGEQERFKIALAGAVREVLHEIGRKR